MNNAVTSWPEPVVRVRELSESGIRVIPDRYVKKPADRPEPGGGAEARLNIPVVDMVGLYSSDEGVRRRTAETIDVACREWGFFQVVNHGVSPELMRRSRQIWREFFELPLEEKLKYANTPRTYEGYGSRLGIEKGISLDWSDYFYLHYNPLRLRDPNKWPSLPVSCREAVEEYSEEAILLCEKLLKILSLNLGLPEDYLGRAFGGDDVGACMRVNYYPKCPQPELTLGLSSHSDPGGMTLLYPDENVAGLQVRHAGKWVTVKPAADAFIVNIGDQIQVLSNSTYKSVEHRVMVSSEKTRLSMAFFYNPLGDAVIKPAEELVSEESPAMYPATTFDEYRMYMRLKGTSGKSQVESLKSPR
ncbi:hypothetical protein M569_13432 [Genlisea aurea]|uniref:Fe2OG dioxygenase domain-containing protein n=1 Tax=Genlisea aurea TaxID=192259 RepID=S8C3J3_9LAMI|nr:hypothetical protein M569_13432 [Genlisea aurea]